MLRFLILLIMLIPSAAASEAQDLSADLFEKLFNSYQVHEADQVDIRQDISNSLAKMELDSACEAKLREGEWITKALNNNNSFGLAIRKSCNPDALFFRSRSKHLKVKIISSHPYTVEVGDRFFNSIQNEIVILIPKNLEDHVEIKLKKSCIHDLRKDEESSITIECR